MGKALLKGTLMALTNACIIWLFAYIAGFDRSVWMVVIIIAGAALAYVTAFLEARAMQNAARGGDVSTSSSVVDSSDSSDSSDEEDDFVDPGPDPDAGDFDAEAPAVRTTAATAAPTTLAAAILAEATPAVAATKL